MTWLKHNVMGGEDGCEWRLEAIIRTRLYNGYFCWSGKFDFIFLGKIQEKIKGILKSYTAVTM